MMATLLPSKGTGKPGGGAFTASRQKLAVVATLGLLAGSAVTVAAAPVLDGADVGGLDGWMQIETGGGGYEWVVAPLEPGAPPPASNFEDSFQDPEEGGSDGWIRISSEHSQGEWVVAPPHGIQKSEQRADAIPVNDEAIAAESMSDWEYLETGPGSGEWVVRSGSDSGPPAALANVAALDLTVQAIPSVIAEGGKVTFATKDNRVSSLKIHVFDVTGRQVFESADQAGGKVQWDLRDQRGTSVPQGMYFYSASGRTSAGRLHSANAGKLLVLAKSSSSR